MILLHCFNNLIKKKIHNASEEECVCPNQIYSGLNQSEPLKGGTSLWLAEVHGQGPQRNIFAGPDIKYMVFLSYDWELRIRTKVGIDEDEGGRTSESFKWCQEI